MDNSPLLWLYRIGGYAAKYWYQVGGEGFGQHSFKHPNLEWNAHEGKYK